MRRFFVAAVFVLAGCGSDQVSKHIAARELQGRPPVRIIPDLLELRYAENTAIAFSLLSGMEPRLRTPLILAGSGAAMAFFLWLVWQSRFLPMRRLGPLLMILAGAFGNLIDRVRQGYVVDFIHVHWKEAWSYPIFNVADSLITVGVVLLLLQHLPKRKPSPSQAA